MTQDDFHTAYAAALRGYLETRNEVDLAVGHELGRRALHDDISVLEAVVQDLRRHYGQNYRIVRAASGGAALDICRQLVERKEAVALLLSDQRMPGMTGVDFLQQALTIFPNAKRVLLTAYADTEAAIRAINSAKIHYYLNKPWDPPEEKLYPVLDDLLGDRQGRRLRSRCRPSVD